MGSEVEPGTLIADKYRVRHVIGEGGMGVVLAADHEELGREVAIKVLKADASPQATARFRREARILGRIDNQHVCRVFDVGALDGGAPFLVMELLEGRDLASLAEGGRRFSIDDVLDYALQACEALAEAHTRGVVHRDLKPANFFVVSRPDGTQMLKLLDFGVAKSLEGIDPNSLTGTGTVVGSPRFMSPEQVASSKEVDCRSDIWSLGVVMHELFTGKAAFGGTTLGEIFINIAQDEPAPLSEDRPDLPPGLVDALLPCFEKDRDDRYPTVADLALALSPFAPPRARPSLGRTLRIYEATGWTPPDAPNAETIVMEAPASEGAPMSETLGHEAPAEAPGEPTSDPATAQTLLAAPRTVSMDEPPDMSDPGGVTAAPISARRRAAARGGRPWLWLLAAGFAGGLAVTLYALSNGQEEPAAPAREASVPVAPRDSVPTATSTAGISSATPSVSKPPPPQPTSSPVRPRRPLPPRHPPPPPPPPEPDIPDLGL